MRRFEEVERTHLRKALIRCEDGVGNQDHEGLVRFSP